MIEPAAELVVVSPGSGTVFAGQRGFIHGIVALGNGTTDITVQVFTDAGLTKSIYARATAAGRVYSIMLPHPLRFENGIGWLVSGIGGTGIILAESSS